MSSQEQTPELLFRLRRRSKSLQSLRDEVQFYGSCSSAVEAAERELSLLKEYALLKEREPSGVYVMPSMKHDDIWHGIVFVRSGMFEGANIRFRMDLVTYPTRDPRVTILTKVLHPQIDINGNTVLSLPTPREGHHHQRHHVWEVVNAVKRLFYRVDDERAVNAEAMQVYTTNKTRFFQLARAAAVRSQAEVRRDVLVDAGGDWDIDLPEWDPNIHEEHLQHLMAGRLTFNDPHDPSTRTEGLSWVKLVGPSDARLEKRVELFSRQH